MITGYLLIFAGGIPIYGRVADLYSLRRVFSVGLVVLSVGSLICALAPTLPFLVAALAMPLALRAKTTAASDHPKTRERGRRSNGGED